jgi:methylthioxylose transferase
VNAPAGSSADGPPTKASARATAVGIGAGVALVGWSYATARWLQHRGRHLWTDAPPLNGSFSWRFAPESLVAVGAGAGGVWLGPRLSDGLPWRRLVGASFLVALGWACALAFADGVHGFTGPPSQIVDYSHTVAQVGSTLAFLRGFVANIHTFAGHVRSHPPGYVVILLAMRGIGLGGPGWQMALQLAAAAGSVPAALLAIREVLGERAARACAPFLMFLPAAVFWGSGDAVFLGFGAWASSLLILASGSAGRRRVLLSIAGGLLFGYLLYLSYGLLLLGLVPGAVIVQRRRAGVAAIACVAALAVIAAFSVSGFNWFSGFAAARREVAMSVQRFRPYWYFLFANVAALAVAVGPAVWAGLGRFVSIRPGDRRAWLLVGAVVAAIAIADLTGLSKGEVERIWLPFMPWLVAVTGVAFEQDERQRWLAIQIIWALGVQFLVRTPW